MSEMEIEKPDERTWPRVIKLLHPIQHGTETITSIEIRRGKIGDIKGMKLGGDVPADQLMLLASRLSGQPVAVIEQLDAEDGGEVMALALDFYGQCLVGGKKRSP